MRCNNKSDYCLYKLEVVLSIKAGKTQLTIEEEIVTGTQQVAEGYAVGQRPPGLSDDGSFTTEMGVRVNSIVDENGRILTIDVDTRLLIEDTGQ